MVEFVTKDSDFKVKTVVQTKVKIKLLPDICEKKQRQKFSIQKSDIKGKDYSYFNSV